MELVILIAITVAGYIICKIISNILEFFNNASIIGSGIDSSIDMERLAKI